MMTDFPWLTAAVGGAARRRGCRHRCYPPRIAHSPSTPALVVALVAAGHRARARGAVQPGWDQYQFVENHPWIPSFGTGYILGVDGIALALVVLTAVLVPLLLVAGWNDAERPARAGRPRPTAMSR